MRISLPVFGFLFGEETKPARQSDNSELSMEQRIKALKTTDPEAYAAIFGKGLTKGKKEVTDAHLATAQDERFANTFNALRNERITRVIREKAKAMRFMNPEDAVMFLSNSLTLNDDL
jgi:hypothetical protein